MFRPVVTTEAHLAYAGARTHSNNNAEMSAMVEALSILGPHGPVARDANSCILGTLGLARKYSQRSPVNSRCSKSSTHYVLPCNMCTHTQ